MQGGEDDEGFSRGKKAAIGIGTILAIIAVICIIVFVSLHFTCTWSLLNTTQCLCEKHGGVWGATGCVFSDSTCTQTCKNGGTVQPNCTCKCPTSCQNGEIQPDCSCKCTLGWTGEYCQISIPSEKPTQPSGGSANPIPDPIPANPIPAYPIPDQAYPIPDPIPVQTPTPSPAPPRPPIPGSFPVAGNIYMIKAPGKPLFLKTVGGSSTGSGQKLDDCKGNPSVCKWIFSPVTGTNNIYNIKASDADLYLRTGGSSIWLANPNWSTDPSTQYELSRGDLDGSFYIRPVSSLAKYVAVKGDWDQDDVPTVLSCTKTAGELGCQWTFDKV